MKRLLLSSARSFSLTGIGVGVASTIVLSKVGRPLLVEVLKLGYEAKHGAQRMLSDAKELASEAEAKASGSKKKKS